MANIKSIRYGVEIETVGRDRASTAATLGRLFGTQPYATGGHYDKWMVPVGDGSGREWTVMTDGSLTTINSVTGGAEVVSPILTFADDEQLQRVVRALRADGSRVDPSCSIHVHVDAAALDAQAVSQLVRLVYRRERQIQHALGTQARRIDRFCKDIPEDLLRRLDTTRPRTLDAMASVWYGANHTARDRAYHYHQSRYHGLNLHSLWFRGTAEGRWFEATLHAGKVRAYALFARALVVAAINGVVDAVALASDASEAESFQAFLTAIGLDGDEFETYREHLTGSLSSTIGSAAASLRTYVPPVVVPAAPPAAPQATVAEAIGRALRDVAARSAEAVTVAVDPVPSWPAREADAAASRRARRGDGVRLGTDDVREPSIGSTLRARRRSGGEVVVTRIANGHYRVDAAPGHADAVGRTFDTVSGAASAACGCRTNGYALFRL